MRGVRDGELPSGVVSLLFSDIEGSTRLLQQLGDLYGNVLAEHDRLLRRIWVAHGGIEVEREGDAFFVAFDDPSAAVRAAVQAQQALDGGLVAFLDDDNALAQISFADALPLARDIEAPAVPYALLGLALTTASSDPEAAVRLHGAVDRQLEESGEHLERLEARLRQESRQQLKALLGEESFQDAIELGRVQQIDAVISEAIERTRLQNPLIPA